VKTGGGAEMGALTFAVSLPPLSKPAVPMSPAMSPWWMGQHRNHEGKQEFDSRGQALAVLSWYQGHGRAYGSRGLGAYQCRVCGKWFLGHPGGDGVQVMEV
jgi:hypothetical protein